MRTNCGNQAHRFHSINDFFFVIHGRKIFKQSLARLSKSRTQHIFKSRVSTAVFTFNDLQYSRMYLRRRVKRFRRYFNNNAGMPYHLSDDGERAKVFIARFGRKFFCDLALNHNE